MAALTALNRKKGSLKAQLTRLETVVADESNSWTRIKIEAKLKSLEKISAALDALRNEYYEATPEETDITDTENEFLDLESRIEELEVSFNELLIDNNTVVKNLPNSNEKNNSCKVKLPEIPLPQFSGRYEDWNTFKSEFNNIVSANSQLTDVQKLHYLHAALKGEAKLLQTQEDTFESLFKALENRFENKRILVNIHIKALLEYEKITHESSKDLRRLVDAIHKNIRALNNLGFNRNDLSDILITTVILEKLDRETRKQFELSVNTSDVPNFDNLLTFLEKRSQTLESIQISKPSVYKATKPIFQNKSNVFVATTVCGYCKAADHQSLGKCSKFLNLSVLQRIDFVKQNRFCFNCLSSMHYRDKCRSLNKCHYCSKNHHTILHIVNNSRHKIQLNSMSPHAQDFTPQPREFIPQKADSGNENATSTVCASNCKQDSKCNQKSHILLCTASIKVQNSNQEFVKCRCLLDTGSQKSFISKECVNKLRLKVKDSSISVSCLGSFNTVANGEVELLFTSHFKSDLKVSTSAFVIDKLTDNIPYTSLPSDIYDKFSDLKLADPLFYKSLKIDILLGVNVFLHLMSGEIVKREPNLPFALNSRIGWIISGTTSFESHPTDPVCVNHLSTKTDELVNSFWELEKIPDVQPLTVEEKLCENHFENSHFREKSGRYSVALPFKQDREVLGESRQMAHRRFLYLEKRLISMPEIYKQYVQFMREYLVLGHMDLDSNTNCDLENNHYYIPHHFVLNNSSLTTKLRVVFDASAKSTTGVSLNDTLMIGPKTQDDLICILLRFRFHNIAITADVRMMYRQIKIHDKDRDFQKILWRDSVDKPIQMFRLNTVTYGTAAAPYLATKVLCQLAIDEGFNFPNAKTVVLRDVYVDDVLTGAKNNEEGAELIDELVKLLNKGGFELHKWSTNNPSLLQKVELANTSSDNTHTVVENNSVKVLGVEWHPGDDMFTFDFSETDYSTVPTKRIILSFISKLFDPLGWIAPFVILTKILLQELWKLQLSWDEPVPENVNQKFRVLCQEVNLLNSICIPRRVILPNYLQCEIHGFCDASQKGYSAVIYVKTFDNSNIEVNLLIAKTRVAPLKPITIPRLELCAAVLLAHLIRSVRAALHIKPNSVHGWSDSKIVLSWLRSDPKRWQVFVSNRVSEIQSILPAENWSHVNGKENPADCASRGLLPSELVSHELWWHGPHWLRSREVPMHKLDPINEDELPEARKTLSFVVSETVEEPEIIAKISSFSKLLRIFAWILRFISNSKLMSVERNTSFLSSSEIEEATRNIIRIVQRGNFNKEIQCLERGKELPKNSNLICLHPFLDENKILRVGGRLKNAQLTENEKHPILLPSKHHLTKILIKHYHEKYLHAAPELLLSLIRQKFWIVTARSVIRKIVRTCVTCCRHKAQTASQIMSDLPTSRVTQSRPFHRVGTDFAGPFMIKYRAGRGAKIFKSYVCVFVCFVIKAVHLEVVEDLSTHAFLSALKRFISRRGKPVQIYSDCGSNFKGAEKEINKYLLQCKKSEEIHGFLSSEEITWSFNPPSAPHFGGLWESTVKSMKSHLKKTVGNTVLTYPEFQTLVTQIEACLNSRPLCPMSSDPSDLATLTPGHFLVGSSLTAIPEPDLSHRPLRLLDRWHVRQFILQQFWKRWSREYLSQLQQRPKWRKDHLNFKLDDLVLIKEDNLPPLRWKLGRIVAIHPGSDGRVRVVTIKTSNNLINRPIVKLCRLPLETENSELKNT